MTTILENANGVRITEGDKMHGHHIAVGALCCCGEHLIVAPTIYQADHRKGDPVMVCRDHGVHAYRFLDLVMGAAAEREACARICEDRQQQYNTSHYPQELVVIRACAAAIRARGDA